MSREKLTQLVLVALLIVAGVTGYLNSSPSRTSMEWTVFAWVAFGTFNVLLNPPGTRWVRMIAIGASFWAILWPGRSLMFVILVGLLWPPAFMVAASLGRRPRVPSEEPQPDPTATEHAQKVLSALIVAVAVAAIGFRWLVLHKLEQTAALFVGIPALLAIVVVLSSPRSAVGVACKAVTIGLLVSLLFLGEGILCIVMSAPLFYAVAIAIALVMKLTRREEKTRTLYSCVLLLVVVPMSLEGVTDFTTMNRDESVLESKIVQSSAAAVERALFETPRFDRAMPRSLRAGFPSPVSTRIERDSGGKTRWVIQFRGGETRLDGMEPRVGDLVLELEEARPGYMRWRAVSDSSHMTHFLNWREAIVSWEPIAPDATRVRWTLGYRRGLDPAWYFGPTERYAVRLAAGYLIDSVATP